jgi:dipeptidyl aminopeptidase/acylaminoacyl peptidase
LHGVPSRLLFFEDECHWVTKPQNAVIWQYEFFEWLSTYLK